MRPIWALSCEGVGVARPRKLAVVLTTGGGYLTRLTQGVWAVLPSVLTALPTGKGKAGGPPSDSSCVGKDSLIRGVMGFSALC